MSRQIVLDTETTGLSPETGDRVIELGCVELVNRKLTGNNLHLYFNPERDSHPDALRVHGLTTEFLSDKPKFAEKAQEILAYLQGAELIIHNAPFDVGFLNKELSLLGLKPITEYVAKVTDSLVMAKGCTPASATRWMRCARAWRWTTAAVNCTAPCWMRSCWQTSTST